MQILLNYGLSELHSLWGKIAEQSTMRQQWITDLDQSLNRVEKDRANMVRKQLIERLWYDQAHY